MGLDWDEGPDVGGPFGHYRQMERLDIYKNMRKNCFWKIKRIIAFVNRMSWKRKEAQMKEGIAPRYSKNAKIKQR